MGVRAIVRASGRTRRQRAWLHVAGRPVPAAAARPGWYHRSPAWRWQCRPRDDVQLAYQLSLLL